MKVLVTGAAGFIAGYLVPELLRHQHQVVGVDNFSKYGPVKRSYDGDPGYQLVEGDANGENERKYLETVEGPAEVRRNERFPLRPGERAIPWDGEVGSVSHDCLRQGRARSFDQSVLTNGGLA